MSVHVEKKSSANVTSNYVHSEVFLYFEGSVWSADRAECIRIHCGVHRDLLDDVLTGCRFLIILRKTFLRNQANLIVLSALSVIAIGLLIITINSCSFIIKLFVAIALSFKHESASVTRTASPIPRRRRRRRRSAFPGKAKPLYRLALFLRIEFHVLNCLEIITGIGLSCVMEWHLRTWGVVSARPNAF